MRALAALGAAAVLAAGCGGSAPEPGPRSVTTATAPAPAADAQASTDTSCTDATCTVRVTCDGMRHVRRGPAPVATRSTTAGERTSVVLDFAGSELDTTIRC